MGIAGTGRHLPMFYINLDSRADRRDYMERQFEVLGLRAERIVASTGTERDGPLSTPEVGCFESHVMAWNRALSGTAPAAIVFEDDACISASMPSLLDSLSNHYDWYDVLRLESRQRLMRLGAPFETSLPTPFTVRRQLSAVTGSAGYVITRRAAEWYLGSPDFMRRAVDAVMFKPPALVALRVLQLVPAPITPVAFRSEDMSVATSDLEATRFRRPRNLAKEMQQRATAAAAGVGTFAPADLLAGLMRHRVPFASPAALDVKEPARAG